MILLVWLGVLAMLLALGLAILARRTIWGLRLRPANPSCTPSSELIILAARLVRGANMEVVPLLADWQARGVLAVERVGPDLNAEPRAAASPGPEWRFTVRDASGLGEVELSLLAAFVPSAPSTGATYLLRRDDVDARDRIWDAVRLAVGRQRASFGVMPRVAIPAAIGLIALAALGGVAALVGSVASGAGSTSIAFAFLGAFAMIVVVSISCRGGRRPTDGERDYRQGIRDLEAWVRETTEPNPALGGWAMLWNLPGVWATEAPEEVQRIRGRDRSFLRGDFARGIPEPAAL